MNENRHRKPSERRILRRKKLVMIVKKGRLTWRYRDTRIARAEDPKNPLRNRVPIWFTSPVEDLKRIGKLTRIRRRNRDAKTKIEAESLMEAAKPHSKPEPSGLISPVRKNEKRE